MRGQKLLTAVAAGAALVGAAQASASATTPVRREARVLKGASECGRHEPERSTLGTVVFERTGPETLSLKVTLRRAEPLATYRLIVYGNGCEFLTEETAFVANKHGVAGTTVGVSVPAGDTEFFADPVNETTFESNDTPYVKLP